MKRNLYFQVISRAFALGISLQAGFIITVFAMDYSATDSFVPVFQNSMAEEIEPIYLGHGLRTPKALSHEKISILMKKYQAHPVLTEAFSIMEGADLAIAHDQMTLLASIKTNAQVIVTKENILNLMKKDAELMTKAAALFDPKNAKDTLYQPFVDQLNALGDQKNLCDYPGRKGITQAMGLVIENPNFLQGIFPHSLEDFTGKGQKAISFRIALFYIDYMKKKALNQDYELSTLLTFCPGSYFGKDSKVKDILSQTSFYKNGIFYAPDNGYLKNGGVSISIPISEIEGIDVRWETGRQLNNPQIIFTDCSGFAQYLARKIHSKNDPLQKQRQMSYHLAAVYDALANEIKKTFDQLYDITGKTRSLTVEEKKYIKNFGALISSLKNVYEPVLNPLTNIKPGDFIIERGSDEGHVMVAVEQNAEKPQHVIILELTGFGEDRGYKWREMTLRSGQKGGSYHRVLRIKN